MPLVNDTRNTPAVKQRGVYRDAAMGENSHMENHQALPATTVMGLLRNMLETGSLS